MINKWIILGCGSSSGVPSLHKGWGECDPKNIKNRRTRTSALICKQNINILIDTGPDFYTQLIRENIRQVDAVLYTHFHADHVHGIDELRVLSYMKGAPIPVYGDESTIRGIRQSFAYMIEGKFIQPHIIEPFRLFSIQGQAIMPILHHHRNGYSIGYRIGSVAYSTDVSDIPAESFAILQSSPPLHTWFLSCTTKKQNAQHASFGKIGEWIKTVAPLQTYFIHMGPSLDYESLRQECQGQEPRMMPAYDGLIIEGEA